MKVAILAGGIGERLTRYCDRLRYTRRFKEGRRIYKR